MAVDIAGLPYDDDYVKSTNFINNKILPYYLNVTLSHGFYVSKHSPWTLVADLGSPAMRNYMSRRGTPTVQAVFNKYYDQCFIIDQRLLRRTFANAYKTNSIELVSAAHHLPVILNCLELSTQLT